jgi:hypothetical protein
MLKKLIPAIKATKRLCFAGIYGHNKRDKERMTKELTGVWRIYLKINSKPLIF